jgi:glucose/arabinose dehydrogenase
MPTVATGAQVNVFADGLDHPRWLYVLPNGDVLVAETNGPGNGIGGIKGWVMGQVMSRAGAGVPSANRITLLRDTDGDGVADFRSILLENLHSPFGMALVDDRLYVANADSLVHFPYQEGQTRISAPSVELTDLRLGTINHHWTKNLLASADGSMLYVAIGSNSNAAEQGMEEEQGRAAIWQVDRISGEHRIFASGLRNPVGMAWEPNTETLWTSVNERDEIGSDLVPDYMTSVQDGGFYGWPYSYFGNHIDERVSPQRPDLVAQAIVPDYALGSHAASLGLAWSGENNLPAQLQNGMMVGQHGSWNRRPPAGYKVIFIPFVDGMPQGEPIDVLSGFLDGDVSYGRPVGVTIDKQGALLVADDTGNTIWRVSASL